MIKAIVGAIALGALSAASPAQVSAPMKPRAIILKPLVLTKLKDLSFGTIFPTGTPEFVQIDPDTGARTMSKEAMRDPKDEGYRAEFGSAGLNNHQVLLKLGKPADLVNAAGKTLKVTNLVLDNDDDRVRKLSPTSQIFFVGVGGEVYIRPNQEEGFYTGTFTLTVTYP